MWLSPSAFRWEVTLTAADPLLYGEWQAAELSTGTGAEDTGRAYQREFGWTYGNPFLPNTALLSNPGNADAQVWALYHGDLNRVAARRPGRRRADGAARSGRAGPGRYTPP